MVKIQAAAKGASQGSPTGVISTGDGFGSVAGAATQGTSTGSIASLFNSELTGSFSQADTVPGSTQAFQIAPGIPALFIFATQDGSISAWNPSASAGSAKIVANESGTGALYTGLALGGNRSGPLLYAANFHAGAIHVFDANFKPVKLPGSFKDPNLPAGFAPFNIRRFGSRL